jgi:hypothetical protein
VVVISSARHAEETIVSSLVTAERARALKATRTAASKDAIPSGTWTTALLDGRMTSTQPFSITIPVPESALAGPRPASGISLRRHVVRALDR